MTTENKHIGRVTALESDIYAIVHNGMRQVVLAPGSWRRVAIQIMPGIMDVINQHYATEPSLEKSREISSESLWGETPPAGG